MWQKEPADVNSGGSFMSWAVLFYVLLKAFVNDVRLRFVCPSLTTRTGALAVRGRTAKREPRLVTVTQNAKPPTVQTTNPTAIPSSVIGGQLSFGEQTSPDIYY